MNQSINVIAIVAANGAIGRGGDQPFHIKEDFMRFKHLTMDHPVIMGRKTFEALPKGALPGRRNIVVTSQSDLHFDDAETAPSLEGAIVLAFEADDEVFVIGGGEIYMQAMEIADRLYLTEVDAAVDDADTFFPAFDLADWNQTEATDYNIDPRSGAPYRFLTFTRRR